MSGVLANHLWHSTLFAGAAALVACALRKNRAAVRYWVWWSASVKFLLPFALLISAGSHLRLAPAAQSVVPVPFSFTVVQISLPFHEGLAAPRHVNWLPTALFSIWACGAAALLTLRLRGWLRIRAALRTSVPTGIAAAVEVRSSPGLLEPGVVGLWRPVLLLPEGIAYKLTTEQLAAVLAHECCHVRRRDNLTSGIHMLVEVMFWFHPLVWWIGARLVAERERACDEEVLRSGGEPRTYADAIVSVCRLYAESPLACVPGVTGANLKRRIEAIMTNYTGQGLTRAKKVLLASAGIAALAGPIVVGVLIGIGNMRITHAAAQTAAPPAPAQSRYDGHRLIAMLIDFTSRTPDEQSRIIATGTDYVRGRMAPADLVAILGVANGRVVVVNDFTGDRAALESAIQALPGSSGSGPASGDEPSRLEAAVRLLGAMPGRKSLIYFPEGSRSAQSQNRAEYQRVIDTAVQYNVAFFPVVAPIAAYQGQPDLSETLVEALRREDQTANKAAISGTLAGLPGSHASILVYAEKDRFSPTHRHVGLVVPPGSFTGVVDILGEIIAVGAADPRTGTPNNHVRDSVDSSALPWQADFMLDPGSYACHLIVRERASGRVYGESVNFEVQ